MNWGFIAGIALSLFIWLSIYSYTTQKPVVTVPKEQQQGYDKHEDKFIAFQLKQYESNKKAGEILGNLLEIK